MKQKLSNVAILALLYCSLFITHGTAAAVAETSVNQRSADIALREARDGLQAYKSYKWFMNLPPFIYNMCAMYYVVPDCMEEMFGDEFDISSMLEEICPAS